jgi:hypothetical protein
MPLSGCGPEDNGFLSSRGHAGGYAFALGRVLNGFGDFRPNGTTPLRSWLSSSCETNAIVAELRPSGSGFPETVEHPAGAALSVTRAIMGTGAAL